MSTERPPRLSYQRSASGEYFSDLRNPLDGERRLRVVAGSRFELEERRKLLKSWKREWQFNIITEQVYRERVRALERRAPAKLRVLWDAYVDDAEPNHASKLRSVWRHQLAPWFDGELAIDLTPSKLDQWERALARSGKARKTIRDAYWLLTACIRRAIPEHIDRLPWMGADGRPWRPSGRGRPPVKRPACGTVGDLEALIAAAADHDAHERARGRFSDLAVRVIVICLCALRQGEGAGLGWDDLSGIEYEEEENEDVAPRDPPRSDSRGPSQSKDRRPSGKRLAPHSRSLAPKSIAHSRGANAAHRQNDMVRVARARIRHQAVDQWRRLFPDWDRPLTPPKGRKERSLILHPDAVVALREQRKALEARGWYRPDGPVFPAPRTNGEWRNNANCIKPEAFKALAAAAGFPDAVTWVPHSLRHSATTLESVAGTDLRSNAKRSGHSSLRVLEDYIHARTGEGDPPSNIPRLSVSVKGDDDE